MTIEIRKLAALAIFILTLLCGIEAVSQSIEVPSADQMTIWRARRVLTSGPEFGTTRRHLRIERSSLHITPESIEFDVSNPKEATRQHYSIDLRTLEDCPAECKDHHRVFFCTLNGAKSPVDDDSLLGLLFYTGPLYKMCFSSDCWALTTEDGQLFVSAVNRLRAFARDSASPLRNFNQQAAAWRALPSKPPLPEEVRLQRLLAEDAIKNKKPAIALFHYEHGLEIDPMWPQGYFNAALIAAEIGLYDQAVEHMQSYLELVPDAPDAQSARDQIVIWRDKAGQHTR